MMIIILVWPIVCVVFGERIHSNEMLYVKGQHNAFKYLSYFHSGQHKTHIKLIVSIDNVFTMLSTIRFRVYAMKNS